MTQRTTNSPTLTTPLTEQPIGTFLETLGAKQPTPGGGAVAALSAAIGAALARMVVSYSEGRKSLAEHADLLAEAQTALSRMATESLDLAQADAEAYGRLNELWKLADDDSRRVREMPAAVKQAIAVPRQVIDQANALLSLCQKLAGRSNRMLASDLAIAAILAESAARAAAWNVRINLPLLESPQERSSLQSELETTLADVAARCAEVERACDA